MSAVLVLRRITVLALLAWVAAPPAWAQQRATPNVMTIHSGGVDYPPNAVVDAGIRQALLPRQGRPISYFTEYLEFDRFPDVEASSALADYIERKYEGRRIDVVIAVTNRAMTFALDHRERLFPGASIVFAGAGISHDDLLRAGGQDVTGIRVGNAYAATVQLVHQLHPQARTVHVVAISPNERMVETVRQELAPYSKRVRLEYMQANSEAALAAAVKAVPRGDVIVYIWYQQAGDDYVTDPTAPARLVARNANVPVYAVVDSIIDTGVVGGMVRDTRRTGVRVGELARKVLEGTRPAAIPLEYAPLHPVFDWRQLRRWGIDERRLPARAVIRFRVPTAWETYRAYIITALVVVTAQLVLITALLAQRAKRRRAEQTVRAREATLRVSYERIRLLAGHLINAQEVTRATVARDLHDDVCQDLVGVAMGINNLARTPGRIQDLRVQQSLSNLQAWALRVVEGVRRLSHELHPASLQLVGLAPALKTHCLEVERRYDTQVAFHASGAFRGLDPEIALCLFRIGQEALRNAAVHGDARRLGVSLARSGDYVELTVTDDGAGFDLETTRRDGPGLGIVSMEERAHLVGGDVEIVTRPGRGTSIRARVPARYREDPAEEEALSPLSAADSPLPTEGAWYAHRC